MEIEREKKKFRSTVLTSFMNSNSAGGASTATPSWSIALPVKLPLFILATGPSIVNSE
jgi:hypothetical protein